MALDEILDQETREVISEKVNQILSITDLSSRTTEQLFKMGIEIGNMAGLFKNNKGPLEEDSPFYPEIMSKVEIIKQRYLAEARRRDRQQYGKG